MSEEGRILAENRRRERELPAELYRADQPGELFLRQDRVRVALALLRRVGRVPTGPSRCLEVGCGRGGWLPELVSWGVYSSSLAGIDLDPERIEEAGLRLPEVDLRVGSATELPWLDGSFDLVVVSTVFSSILDAKVRRAVCDEVTRVLARDGALLWYDIRVDNPRNRNVRGISRRELARLFPALELAARSAGLLPPLARPLARLSPTLAAVVAALAAPLRSHLVAVLTWPP